MNIVENNFPRGGKKKKNLLGTKRKQEVNLFDDHKSKKVKKLHRTKVENDVGSEDRWQTSINLQGTLAYNKMQEGMIVLSCVRHICNLSIQIEFPGLTFGIVTINQISDIFTKQLTDSLKLDDEESSVVTLKSIVKVGQFMPAKILSVGNSENGYEVHATVNPKDINSDRIHNSFKKGMTLWANVVSELDHGYELSLGIHNCRVFLPYKNTEEAKKYNIGEPLFCIIHKVDSSTSATTLTVSAKREHVDKPGSKDDLNLDDVIPGLKVEFLIDEVLPQGIKGHFFEKCFGYIDESQVMSKIDKRKLKEGTFVSAYVLYVETITKVTYLTLHGLEDLSEPDYEVGKVTSSKILSNISKGIYVTLGKSDLGFVTNKRLLNTLPREAQINIIDSIRKKYPIGSSHECRILDYNYMQQVYICTFEKQIIKEKIFSAKDLKLGQVVTVKIDKIVPNGLIVKSGHVQGFVPNIHLSNVKYSANIKGKFSEGMTVNARVLNITSNENLIFTLKQGLIESEKCLASIEDAAPNAEYIGFVVQTKISGVLIAFYGGVKGWLSNKILNSDNFGRYLDPRSYFFIGQVVNVWVLGIKENKVLVSLNFPKTKQKIKLGEISDGTIKLIHSNGIDIQVGREKIEATIPVSHLSRNLTVCSLLSKTYQVGDHIINLMCINIAGSVPIMSRREYAACENGSNQIPKIHDLKKTMVLRCSFEGSSDSGIYVSTPIEDHPDRIFIPNEKIFQDKESFSTYQKQQCILAKILYVDYTTKRLDLSIGFPSRNNEDVNDSLAFVTEAVEDLDYLTNLYAEKKLKLTEYKIGERVKCEVQEIDVEGNCFVTLSNGIQGVASVHLGCSKYVVGSTIEGVVIDYNFLDDRIEICLKNSLKQKISKIQDGFIDKSFNSSCTAKILSITKFYALGILNDSQCNRQLVYLPLFSNGNLYRNYLGEGKFKLKIFLCGRVGSKLIGLPKRVAALIKQNEQKCKTRKGKTSLQSEDMEVNGNESDDSGLEEANEIVNNNSDRNTQSSTNVPWTSNFKDTDTEEQCLVTAANSFCQEDNEKLNKQSVLSGTESFYNVHDSDAIKDESSSEDEEEEEKKTKKKKLSTSERADLAKREEERIVMIEKELADTTTPQSAEHFDRLLLASPNSSQLWLQYMSMHVAAAELEKARSVGRRAIENINMTLVKEKFNIWIALLNLENMYGTKESFEKLFEEAVKSNDSVNIYLNVIKMLASSGKLIEMEEKIKKLTAREKQSTKMWLEVGQVYYRLQKFKEARNVKESALKSILDKKRQFDLIVRFGIMEFQLGDLDQAFANFETILDSYPRKVNIWIIFTDQLVKKNKIHLARKVLENAVSQKLGMRAMKILFRKFINFEEQHGCPESIEDVKIRAKAYVKSLDSKCC